MKTVILLAPAMLMLTIAMPEAQAESGCTAMLAPASTALRDTGFDQNRVACGASGFGIGMRSLATVDAPNFYGTLSAALMLDYRHLHLSGFEFSISARLVDYRFAQSAVFTDGQVAAGPISLGVLRPRKTTWWNIPVHVGHQFRLELPKTNTNDASVVVAASPAVLATLMPTDSLHVHGRLSALLWSVLPESGADSRAAMIASTDFSYAPVSLLSFTAGVESQMGWYGLGLDHVQVRGGLRVAVVRHGAFEISAARVVAGDERNDVVAWVGYRAILPKPEKPKRSRLQDWAR